MTKLTITLLVIISFAFTNTVLASAGEGKWEIKGQLIDEATGETIPYATVALYSRNDSSLIQGSISDFDGHFSLEKVTKRGLLLRIKLYRL